MTIYSLGILLSLSGTELCLSVSCGGMGQQWIAAGTLAAAELGMAEALLEEVTINPTLELPELIQG